MSGERIRRPVKGVLTIAIVIFVLICLGALLTSAVYKALRRARFISCISGLSNLWKMENVYMARNGRMGLYPPETGGAFWLKLNVTDPPLIKDSDLEIFFCPVVDREVVKGGTDYLGPRMNVQQLGCDDWIGGDRPGNHGRNGGNMLRKNADIFELEPTEFLEAASRCRP